MRQLTATAIIIILLSTGCYYETQETKFGRKDTLFAAKGEREKPFVSMVPITTDIHYSKDLVDDNIVTKNEYDRLVFKKLGVYKSKQSLIFSAKNILISDVIIG